jgi:hypothetical protein
MTNPLTEVVLVDTRLVPNLALKGAMQHWRMTAVPKVNVVVLPCPTLALGRLYVKRKSLSVEYKVDIEIESDACANEFGVRQVTLRPQEDTSETVQLEYRIWSIIQQQCHGKTTRFDDTTGLPFSQLMFSIPSSNYKIGQLLQKHEKMKMEKRFRVSVLVEKRRMDRFEPCDLCETRTVLLTAWLGNHTDAETAMKDCRDFILFKLQEQ